MNIEKMIKIVCGLIAKETGVDIKKNANASDLDIKNAILRKVWDGMDIRKAVQEVKSEYGVSFITWAEKTK